MPHVVAIARDILLSIAAIANLGILPSMWAPWALARLARQRDLAAVLTGRQRRVFAISPGS